MQPAEIVNMFAVPFAFARHPAPEALNQRLLQFALEAERSGGAANPRPLTQRNAQVFESRFDLFRDANPAVQELKRFCWEHLLAVVGRLNGYDRDTLRRLELYNESWFHVTRNGGYFGLHNHPNASWSGVYCVDDGRPNPANKQSGVLTFVSPFLTYGMHMDAGIANMQLPYAMQTAGLSLVPGQLVLFPSWVLHDVKPFDGEALRVTIAFNCWFRLPD